MITRKNYTLLTVFIVLCFSFMISSVYGQDTYDEDKFIDDITDETYIDKESDETVDNSSVTDGYEVKDEDMPEFEESYDGQLPLEQIEEQPQKETKPEWIERIGVEETGDKLKAVSSHIGHIEDVSKAYGKGIFLITEYWGNKLIEELNAVYKEDDQKKFADPGNAGIYCYVVLPGCVVYGYMRNYQGVYDDTKIFNDSKDSYIDGYSNSNIKGYGPDARYTMSDYFYFHEKEGTNGLKIMEMFFEIEIIDMGKMMETLAIEDKYIDKSEDDAVTTYVTISCPRSLLNRAGTYSMYINEHRRNYKANWVEKVIEPKIRKIRSKIKLY